MPPSSTSTHTPLVADGNPLATITSYRNAREHAELPKSPHPDTRPVAPVTIEPQPVDVDAAVLWVAARGEAPSMRDVHRWPTRPNPPKAIAPLVAALRHHTDHDAAWDAAIVERDVRHANNRNAEFAAAFAAWDDPRIIDATTGQPGPPARVTGICDRRPSPARVCAVNLIAHSLQTATGAVLITECLYANQTTAFAAGRPTRFVIAAQNHEPPDDATVHLRVQHARSNWRARPGRASPTRPKTRPDSVHPCGCDPCQWAGRDPARHGEPSHVRHTLTGDASGLPDATRHPPGPATPPAVKCNQELRGQPTLSTGSGAQNGGNP